MAARILERLGVSVSSIREELERQPTRTVATPSPELTLTPRGKRAIDLAYQEARSLKNEHIGTEHLLLGLLREEGGIASRVLTAAGTNLVLARREAVAEQMRSRVGPSNPDGCPTDQKSD